jgi:hypothetical protein
LGADHYFCCDKSNRMHRNTWQNFRIVALLAVTAAMGACDNGNAPAVRSADSAVKAAADTIKASADTAIKRIDSAVKVVADSATSKLDVATDSLKKK